MPLCRKFADSSVVGDIKLTIEELDFSQQPETRHAYGAFHTQLLAAYDPEAAVLNADNYALYTTAIFVGADPGLPTAQNISTKLVRHVELHNTGARRPPWMSETDEGWEWREFAKVLLTLSLLVLLAFFG